MGILAALEPSSHESFFPPNFSIQQQFFNRKARVAGLEPAWYLRAKPSELLAPPQKTRQWPALRVPDHVLDDDHSTQRPLERLDVILLPHKTTVRLSASFSRACGSSFGFASSHMESYGWKLRRGFSNAASTSPTGGICSSWRGNFYHSVGESYRVYL